MILVDTSVWVDHLREGQSELASLLDQGLVLGHPSVIGELSLGHLDPRQEVLDLLSSLPPATVATAPEVLALIDGAPLIGIGIGYVDAQLLSATRLTPGSTLWTVGRRLRGAAERLGVAFDALGGNGSPLDS